MKFRPTWIAKLGTMYRSYTEHISDLCRLYIDNLFNNDRNILDKLPNILGIPLSNIYRASIDNVEAIYTHSTEHAYKLNRSIIEHTSNIYRQSWRNISNIFPTLMLPLAKLYRNMCSRIGLKSISNLYRSSIEKARLLELLLMKWCCC